MILLVRPAVGLNAKTTTVEPAAQKSTFEDVDSVLVGDDFVVVRCSVETGVELLVQLDGHSRDSETVKMNPSFS